MTRRTSMVAYRKIKTNGLLTKARMRVYEWLFKNGPATATEIEVELGNSHAHKRLSELRDQNVVEEIGERKCLVTGHTVILWDVTENLPLDPGSGSHGKTRKQVDSERDWLFGECLRLRAVLEGYQDQTVEVGEIRRSRKMVRMTPGDMKQVLRLLQADPHSWSVRPCSTCRTISGIVGEPFGCVLHAQQRAKKTVGGKVDDVIDAAIDELGRDKYGY